MPRPAPPPPSPVQRATLEVLGAGTGRPTFPSELKDRLRSDLEDGLAPLVENLAVDECLVVSKHLLGQVHSCQVRLLAEDDGDFNPSVPIARGTISHKAIELGIHWPHEPYPLDLVDEAMARVSEGDHWLTEFLQTCSEAERAELRATAGDRVSKFFECFPPLQPKWRPVTESSLWIDLVAKRVTLKGKVDLTLGAARGNEAGKVIIDLKTGSPRVGHRDDLRFYALLDTLRIGVPPRLIASFYLDTGIAEVEPVTEALLDATVARTVDGAVQIAELRAGTRAPIHRPAHQCRWCPVLSTCDVGRRWLADEDIPVPQPDEA
ncbi:MAG: PD-(D/E)XK nuclease family protein [Microthrixaceae bacterium]|nr:PD-(D/E)XK nuclease family protein [Acidimicrobiales bacterium]MCB9403821.1 PD-(D/E)XK nuclease family protein [Microthrixaceae bacterium]